MERLRAGVWVLAFALLPLTGLPSSGFAAAKKGPKRRKHPAFLPIKDAPDLPRALLIGDSISIGYTGATRQALAGKVNVHRAPTNCGPTTSGLEQLDKWLGSKKWDVVHFNWGLHDLKYVSRKGARLPPEQGKQQVPIEQYERNLETLAERLKKTGAKLIWASTTPVPDGAGGRVKGDEVKYNAAAEKIMKEHGVAINDLYAFALPRLEKLQKPRNVHFNAQGSKALAEQVAASILQALEK